MKASNHCIHRCRILNPFSLFSLSNLNTVVVLSFDLSKPVECFGCWMVLLSRQRVETIHLGLHASRAAQGRRGPTLLVVSVCGLQVGTLRGCFQTSTGLINSQMVIRGAWHEASDDIWGYRRSRDKV